jgi:hypothetical protein
MDVTIKITEAQVFGSCLQQPNIIQTATALESLDILSQDSLKSYAPVLQLIKKELMQSIYQPTSGSGASDNITGNYNNNNYQSGTTYFERVAQLEKENAELKENVIHLNDLVGKLNEVLLSAKRSLSAHSNKTHWKHGAKLGVIAAQVLDICI